MRLNVILAASALAVLGAGCKPPPADQLEEAFRREVRLYFNNLNQDANFRKDVLRKERAVALSNPAMHAPSGTVLNFYLFDDAQALSLTEKKSGNLLVTQPELVAAEQAGDGAALLGKGPAPKLMFELTQNNPEKPMRATVRYIRRVYTYDERGSVKVTDATKSKIALDMTWIPTAGNVPDPASPLSRYSLPGYHRVDGTFVGEIEFEFKGGSLRELSRKPERAIKPWRTGESS